MRHLNRSNITTVILLVLFTSGCATTQTGQSDNIHATQSNAKLSDNIGLPPKDGFDNASELKHWLNSIKPAAGNTFERENTR